MKIIITFFILVSSFVSIAQDKFTTGYIVTNNLDTIRGLISEGSKSFSSELCVFKLDSSTTSTEYSPGQIHSFFFLNRLYRSKKVTYEVTGQSFFVECLFDGKVDLYKLSRIENDYFFADKDNVLHQLTQNNAIVYTDGKRVELNTKLYIGVLKALMNEDINFHKKIEQAELKELSLIKLFNEYHSTICGNDCVHYAKQNQKREKKSWRFGVGGSLQFINNSHHVKTNIKSTLTSSIIGVPLNVSWSTNANISQSYSRAIPAVQLLLSDKGGRTFVMEIKYLNYNEDDIQTEIISLPITYQKRLNFSKKVFPYVLFGTAVNNYLSTSVKDRVATFASSSQGGTIEISSKEFDWRGVQFSPIIGFGLKRPLANGHQLQIEASYKFAVGLPRNFITRAVSTSGSWTSELTSGMFSFSLSYQVFFSSGTR